MNESFSSDGSHVLYGKETYLASRFMTHGRKLSEVPEMIRAYAWVKEAAAEANVQLGAIDPERGNAIKAAAKAVSQGKHDRHFPLAVVQGGGGTSTNMNVNEVIATLATEMLWSNGLNLIVHPNDHVNRSQSTNDSYPTAMALALFELLEPLLTAFERLAKSFQCKAEEYPDYMRLGRTCLRDALPLTVGDTHRAHSHSIQRTAEALQHAVMKLREVPLGATAIGTGVGCPPGFSGIAIQHLSKLSGRPIAISDNFFDSLANLDQYSAIANSCVRAATVMAKIAADLRLLSSGPISGIGEVELPALVAGSSIMPGKINPAVPELVMQLNYRIRGGAVTVDCAVAAGELELNVMEPIILDTIVAMFEDLTYAADVFATSCVDGLLWNGEAVRRHLGGSLQGLIAIAKETGYDAAQEMTKPNQINGPG